MKKKYHLLLLLCLPFLGWSQPHQTINKPPIIIRFQPKIDAIQFFQTSAALQRTDIQLKTIEKVSSVLNMYKMESSNNEQLLRLIKGEQAVLNIGYDFPLQYRESTPNDTNYDLQWHMRNVRADLVWNETTGGQTMDGHRIVIGVLEKAFEATHEDLVDNIWTNEEEIPDNQIDDDGNGFVDDYFGWNVLDRTDNHTSTLRNGFTENHGTQVAGVIGAKGNNGIGVTGINWDIDLLLLSKVGLFSELMTAHEYAFNLRKKFNETNGQEGAFIVALNHSFGWDSTPENASIGKEVCKMIDTLGQIGILSVAATDNREYDVEVEGDVLPNCVSDFLIGVTNSDEQDNKVRRSGYGEISIDLAAPGEQIYSLDLNNGYTLDSGTSFSCPMVSGAIGLLYSLSCGNFGEAGTNNPAGTAKLMKEAILNTVEPLPDLKGITTTGGRLDVFAAKEAIQLNCEESPSTQLSINEIFPNPATSSLTIAFETPNYESSELLITNQLGQLVHQEVVPPTRFAGYQLLDVEGFSTGVYFLSLRQGDELLTRRFVVGR